MKETAILALKQMGLLVGINNFVLKHFKNLIYTMLGFFLDQNTFFLLLGGGEQKREEKKKQQNPNLTGGML